MLTTIILPFPPSVNGLYGGGSAQKRFPTQKYKNWLKSCPALHPHNLDNIEIHYRYYFPDKRNRDTENYVKAVSDYLVNNKVIIDDNWLVIKKMTLTPMEIDRLNPRVEIFIESL